MSNPDPAVILNPRLVGFRCIRCDAGHPIGDYAEGCPACSEVAYPASVVPVYSDLPALGVDRPGRGTRRFGDRLPFSSFPTLGEGDTPVARLHRLAEELGLDAVDIKLEGSNPTGSHKDRMTSQFVARALIRRAPVVAAASSGNAGASLAAYAAAAGLRCAIVTKSKISPAWRRAIEMSGAELHFVEDPLDRFLHVHRVAEGKTAGLVGDRAELFARAVLARQRIDGVKGNGSPRGRIAQFIYVGVYFGEPDVGLATTRARPVTSRWGRHSLRYIDDGLAARQLGHVSQQRSSDLLPRGPACTASRCHQ